jgi:hypothetical protein
MFSLKKGVITVIKFLISKSFFFFEKGSKSEVARDIEKKSIEKERKKSRAILTSQPLPPLHKAERKILTNSRQTTFNS